MATPQFRVQQLAEQFWRDVATTGDYHRDLIACLSEMATAPDESAVRAATEALFSLLVERLADSFEPVGVRLYNRLFAQVIEHCRHTEKGSKLHEELNRFGLYTEADLVRRAERLRQLPARWRGDNGRVRRVLLLSRVTIGADVAITSVMIERLKQEFPRAEIVLVGGGKLKELFGGDAQIRLQPLPYQRADVLLNRLLSWLDLVRAVHRMTDELEAGEYVVVDPDSRLTQLGLLPIAPSERADFKAASASPDYLFFPSREYQAASSLALGELTRHWLNETFEAEQMVLPRLRLAPVDCEMARALIRRLNPKGTRKMVTLNFGVGNNVDKRIGDEFEKELVAHLLQSSVAVILDKGAGEDEGQRADAIIRHALAALPSLRVIEVDERNLQRLLASTDAPPADLLVWQGRLGLLAAMIAESALYIGYDSAGQHLAAALGIGCIDVMAGFTSPRVADRWRPTGAAAHIVTVDRSAASFTEKRVLIEVLGYARERLRLD